MSESIQTMPRFVEGEVIRIHGVPFRITRIVGSQIELQHYDMGAEVRTQTLAQLKRRITAHADVPGDHSA